MMSYCALGTVLGTFCFILPRFGMALGSILCVDVTGYLELLYYFRWSLFLGKVLHVLCHCFSAFSNTFYLWNTMVFIRYSSSFCSGVAPTDVLSFLFVLNDNKWIIIPNAMTLGGGTFLKLGLCLILFWKLLCRRAKRHSICEWGQGQRNKVLLLHLGGWEADTWIRCFLSWWGHNAKLESKSWR